MTTALPTLNILNASFITPLLLVGGDLDPDDNHAEAQLKELVCLGVRHIVDTRQEWSDEAFVRAFHPSVRYHHLGIDDAGQAIPDSWFDTAVRQVLGALAAGDRVLIHCHMGVNRSTSLMLAVLLSSGWDLIEAMDQIRRQRPIAVMAYADDVLGWHHRRTGASSQRRREDRSRVQQWRQQHPLDVVRVIRTARQHERGAWRRAGTSRYLAS